MTDAETVLQRLRVGPATLAQLRAAFPPGHLHARAMPSMGEEDPLVTVLTGLAQAGGIREIGGVWSAC